MIPVFKPHIGSETLLAASQALDLGWLGMGSLVKEFEEGMARYLEVEAPRQVVAVNTCTSALHLALLASGVGPGDEVITPALNNIGDFQAIAMCGAEPVFADVREDDLGLDPEAIEPLVGPRVKAVIALHYMGIPCRIEAIRNVTSRRGLRLIEDAAHATGTRTPGGRPLGADGDLACFSFDAIKTLTCVDGGLIVVPSAEEASQLYPLRLLGMTQPNERLYSNSRAYKYDVYGPGFRYHLANLHAAIGSSQLRRLPEFISNRRAYCRLYKSLLDDVPGIVTPRSDFADCSMFIFVIRVLDQRRTELAAYLKEHGVETGVHWIPANQLTWLRNSRGASNLPVTDKVGEEILTLPLWSFMPEETILQVANRIREFFGRASEAVKPQSLRGQPLLDHIKTTAGDPYKIPVPNFPGVFLRVISTSHPEAADVDRLSVWRNQNVRSFLTEFDATPARTLRWLTSSVAQDSSRILFMIDEEGQPPLGYIGLAFIDWKQSFAEADSVVRGREGRSGVMSGALQTLIGWGRESLGLSAFGVRVLAENPANSFYSRFGFRERTRIGLRCERSPGLVAWKEVGAGDAGNDRSLIVYDLPVRKSDG